DSVPSTQHSALPTKLPKHYALKTQRLCQEDGKFQPGAVLIENGKIADVGPKLTISDAIPVYELGSLVVTPGLVAGHSQLGLASAIDDPAEADAAQVRAGDVYDPQHRAIRELLGAGFTSVLFAPGSANVIAGAVCGVRLGVAEPLGDDAGLKFVLTAS